LDHEHTHRLYNQTEVAMTMVAVVIKLIRQLIHTDDDKCTRVVVVDVAINQIESTSFSLILISNKCVIYCRSTSKGVYRRPTGRYGSVCAICGIYYRADSLPDNFQSTSTSEREREREQAGGGELIAGASERERERTPP